MKTLLILLILTSCSIHKQLEITPDKKVIIIDKRKDLYQVRDLDDRCYASFYCNDKIKVGDTVSIEKVTFGSLVDFELPEVKLVK